MDLADIFEAYCTAVAICTNPPAIILPVQHLCMDEYERIVAQVLFIRQ